MKNLVDKVKDGVKSLSDGVKKHARNAVVYTAIGAAALGVGGGKAYGDIQSFYDLIGPGDGTSSQAIAMSEAPVGNLMIRDEVTGIPEVVSTEGVWRIGLIKYDADNPNNMFFGAYANNAHGWTGEYAAWCQGQFYDNIFEDGDNIDEVLIVHDRGGNGIGSIVDGSLDPGADDTYYWTEDIEFNGVQGDPNQLGTFSYENPKLLLPITIDAREPRTDSSNMSDLVALAENWLAPYCNEGNSDCNGADWNYDGKVNLVDFAHMANGWYSESGP